MATIVNLPDGETATLRDDSELTNREVKELRHVLRQAIVVSKKYEKLGFDAANPDTWETALEQITDEDDDVMDLYQRTCVIIRLKHWTLDRDIPADADGVDDLPRPVYAAITLAAAKINFSDDFGVDPDPKANGAS